MRIRVSDQMHKSVSADWCFRTKAHSGIDTGWHPAMTRLLITETEREQLLVNGRVRAAGHTIDPHPVVRLFTPDAHATWLLAALDPADEDTAYGLCDVGIGMPALGFVKLSELASIVGPLKRPVMRDLHFLATRTLAQYTQLAQRNGSIID